MSNLDYPNDNIGRRYGDFVIEGAIMRKQTGIPSKVG